MIRTSKHNISNNTNCGKISCLDSLFIDYRHDLEIYINYIIDGVLPLKTNLSSKKLPTEVIKYSKYKREIYKQASEIIRSQIDRAKNNRYNKYKQVYAYFKESNRQQEFISKKFSELNLNPLLQSKWFAKPILKNISINLTNEFFNIKKGNHFDFFFNLKLPYFNKKGTRAIQINLPLNYHKHSDKFLNGKFKLKNSIQLKNINGKYYVSLIWEKENVGIKQKGKAIGIDTGYRKLIATSEGQIIGDDMIKIYESILNKQRNSKSYKKALLERDNLINYYANMIDTENVNKIVVEDLNNVKHKSKFNNKVNDKLSRWTYRSLLNKIEMMCEVKGIELMKVSPRYTSQTCSLCGYVDKKSRKSDSFLCTKCGYKIDADYNAAINIRNRGATVPLTIKN